MYTGVLIDILGMGGSEIMLIMVVILLLFGGKKLPELARGLGKGIRDFKDASEGVKREIHRNINSSGIMDDVKDIVSDVNDNSRYHPSENSYVDQYDTPKSDADLSAGPIDLEKKSNLAATSRIETDKTKL